MTARQRRRFGAEEKIAILRRHLLEQEPVFDRGALAPIFPQ